MSKSKTVPVSGYQSVYSDQPLSVQQMLAPTYDLKPTPTLTGHKVRKSILPLPGLGKFLGGSSTTPIYENVNKFNPADPNADVQQMVDYAYRLLNPNLFRK